MANTQSEHNLISLRDGLEIAKRTTEAHLKMIRKGMKVRKQTFVFYSLPGIGKSEGFYSLAKSKDHIAVIDINAEFGGSLSMPIQDVEYIPEQRPIARVLHALHEDIDILNNHAKQYPDEPHYLFLDEYNRGDEFMKQTIMQLMLNNRLPGHELADNIFIMAAGNTAENVFTEDENISNDVNPLDSASRDRISPLFIKLNADHWLEWAYQHDIHPYILMFIENSEGTQDKHDKLYNAAKNADGTGATPRSWAKLSDLLKIFNLKDEPTSLINGLVASQIGSGLAKDFINFVNQQPAFDLNDLLKDPNKALSKFEQLSSPVKKQALCMSVSYINGKLKNNDPVPFNAFESILQTRDQQALERFIRIFIENDIMGRSFPEMNKALKKSPAFTKINALYSMNAN